MCGHLPTQLSIKLTRTMFIECKNVKSLGAETLYFDLAQLKGTTVS